jgi:hypothetical protein
MTECVFCRICQTISTLYPVWDKYVQFWRPSPVCDQCLPRAIECYTRAVKRDSVKTERENK